MKKLYMFSNTVTVTEETQVEAKSFAVAVDIFYSGVGITDEVDANGGDWEGIDNTDELEEEEA